MNDPNEYVAEGDVISVRVLEIDRMGRVKLSAKAVSPIRKSLSRLKQKTLMKVKLFLSHFDESSEARRTNQLVLRGPICVRALKRRA